MVGEIQLSIQLDAIVRHVDEAWIATCPPLDVATQAETCDAALAALKEAVEGWFESCLDRRVLEQALKECGFQRSPRPSQNGENAAARVDAMPTPNGHRTIQCSVPAYVLAALNELRAPR